MFFIYAVLVHVAFVLLLPLLLLNRKLREGIRSRFGFYPAGWPGGEGRPERRPTIWFHGASAGDLLALRPVIAEVRGLLPKARIVVTTITNSGMTMARKMLEGVDACGYLPYDLPFSVSRAVKAIRPDVLVLEYAEVWPALLRGVRRSGAGIILINGRFDERSLGHYRWFYRLVGNPLRHLDLLCMRDEAEAEHAVSIGADPKKVRVTGNTKFDSCRQAEPTGGLADLARDLGVNGTTQVFLAGSTHEGEEGPLFDVFVRLRKKFADLKMIVAPRYIERTERLEFLAQERGIAYALRSRGAGAEPLVILDTVGELRGAYELATVVFVGGSFARHGGHNILEPAACGKPVLFGPHMENFRGSVRVLLGRGGIQVPDPDRIAQVLSDLLSSPDEVEKLGRMARQAVIAVQGASAECARVIVETAGARRGS
ncbi:MAG TPA: glycosyltransferase N-terminal domain-containing protein [Myxococcota bacterium]|nr:glycosyltransferase N-terminal domain-containing protein [Myxococcota bacterium]